MGSHIKQKYSEHQRKTEKEVMKLIKWQVNDIVQQATGTNISKTIFKKRDFSNDLYQAFINGEEKKRDVKLEGKTNNNTTG